MGWMAPLRHLSARMLTGPSMCIRIAVFVFWFWQTLRVRGFDFRTIFKQVRKAEHAPGALCDSTRGPARDSGCNSLN